MRRLGDFDDFFKEDEEEFLTDKSKVDGKPWKNLKQDAMQKDFNQQEWFVSNFILDLRVDLAETKRATEI